jgi:hypothetical protein
LRTALADISDNFTNVVFGRISKQVSGHELNLLCRTTARRRNFSVLAFQLFKEGLAV